MVGIEPTTFGMQAQRYANWAMRSGLVNLAEHWGGINNNTTKNILETYHECWSAC